MSDTWPADLVSGVPGVVWPAVPAAAAAPTFTIAAQLAHSERLPAAVLRAQQRAQLTALLRHAAASAPFYAGRLGTVLRKRGLLDWDRWQRLPCLTRPDVQQQFRALASRALPRSHGPVREAHTSGSTGTPIGVLESALQQTLFRAVHLRKYRWHQVRLEATIAAARSLPGTLGDDWGERRKDNWTRGVRTGPSHVIDVRAPIDRQADWLARCRPHYLLTYPSNLAALADHVAAENLDFGFLEQLHTFGEVVDETLRARCLEVFGLAPIDMYSAIELGVVALQAPGATHQHVMSETHFVEVLKANGDPCLPGETGRVVVTPLHGFAMPLVRYENGDFAEVGEPARDFGLPVLARVVGRARNMAMLAGGGRFWPQFGGATLRRHAPLRQVQLVQHAIDAIEVRVVPSRPFTDAERTALERALGDALGHPFRFEFTFVDAIAPGPGGKYEDFICQVQE